MTLQNFKACLRVAPSCQLGPALVQRPVGPTTAWPLLISVALVLYLAATAMAQVDIQSAVEGEKPGSWTQNAVERERLVGPVKLRALRIAAQADFERVVFEFSSVAVPAYRVSYIDSVLPEDGTAAAAGVAAYLEISILPASAREIRSPRLPPGLKRLLQFTKSYDADGNLLFRCGLDAKRSFRVLELGNPARLVVDIGR